MHYVNSVSNRLVFTTLKLLGCFTRSRYTKLKQKIGAWETILYHNVLRSVLE
jgi:hypothetical protein